MPAQILNLIKGDSAGSDTDYRDALPVNMVGVAHDVLGVKGYMIQYPGLTSFSDLGSPCRGGVWNERFNKHFRINGNLLFELDSNGVATTLGTITGSDTASLAYSFNTQAIVANGNYWLYDDSNGLVQVTDSDVGSPIDVVWIDGYYFFTDGDFIYHTDINDESSIDPLKFATAEFSPDPTLGVAKTQDDKAVVFDRYSTQYFNNTANENFAFTWLKSRSIKKGIVGTHCKAEVDGSFYILGGGKEEAATAYSLSVGGSRTIATREIDKVIQSYAESELSKSIVETYAEDGYQYIIYHLPNDTLIFNLTLAKTQGINQAWSVLKTNDYANYRAIHYVNDVRLNKWVVGDKINGNVGILDNLVATQYGEMSQWELYTPWYYLESKSITQLEVDTLPGFNDFGDATVSVSMTYDGVNYSKNWFLEYGSSWSYNKRFVLRRLGYVRDWFGLRIRAKTRSRMAFSKATIKHG